MFTGIIREIGILNRKERNLANGSIIFSIQSRELLKELKKGSSIAVNGVCLTIIDIFKDSFKVDIMEETFTRTNLGLVKIPAKLNLEPALVFGEKIDGAFVTGHVDDVGKIVKKGIMEGGITLEIQFPAVLSKFLTSKGSITVNGVSLTIIDVKDDIFKIGLIPYTQKNTNLGDTKEEDTVNLEIDLIARYLDTIYENSNRSIGLQ